jgi:hypothetical protein
VPWRFSDAGRKSAWIASSCRHPKTCTKPEVDRALKSVYLPLKRFPKGDNLNLLVDRRCRMIGILQF